MKTKEKEAVMDRNEIAGKQLRQVVKGFQKNGMPETVSFFEFRSSLARENARLIKDILDLTEEFYAESTPREEIASGSDIWNKGLKIREKLQEAFTKNLFKLEEMQTAAILFGAVPDPMTEWKSYRLPNGSYACWECGQQIIAVNSGLKLGHPCPNCG